MASAGWPNWTALPSTSIVPPEGRLDPDSTPNSSSWPWPSSATTPSTSPARRSNETSSSFVPTRRLRTLKRAASSPRSRERSRRVARSACALLDRGAEHQLDDLLLRARRHVDDAHRLAVAQHGGAVAERGDLEQPVRDEDHRAAGLALAPHDVEHLFGEIRRQRRGHLVEQQHVGLDRQRAREIEHAQDGERDVRAPSRGDRGRARRAPRPSPGTARPASRSGADWRRRRGRGSAPAPGRPTPARRGGPRPASAPRAPRRGSGSARRPAGRRRSGSLPASTCRRRWRPSARAPRRAARTARRCASAATAP